MGHCYPFYGLLLSAVIIIVSLQGVKSSPNEISAGEQAKSSSHDVDSVTNSCISNWKQLLDLFHKDRPVRLDRQTMLIFFHVRILHSLESTCCTLNDSNDSCIMMASLVHSLFGQYPPPLLLLLGGAGISQLSPQKYNGILSKAVKEICWEPQIPFCHEVLHFSSGIIKDFVAKILPSEVASNNDAYVQPWTFTPDRFHGIAVSGAMLLYSLLVFISLAVLMSVLWLMRRYSHSLHPRAPVAKAFLFSVMLQSWTWFFSLYGYQFWALSLFKDFLYSRNAFVSFAYMPFVDMGYITFGAMGALFLVEFPFLCWYISAKVMLSNGGQCVPNTLKSIGCAGMVLFAQILSSYCVYYLMMSLVFPLYPIFFACVSVIVFAFLSACTALVILPCLTGCRRCPQNSCFIVFSMLLAINCAGVLCIIGDATGYNSMAMFNANSIVSGLFVSCAFAALGFTLRSLLGQNAAHRGEYLPIP